jgi:hypothetical protein
MVDGESIVHGPREGALLPSSAAGAKKLTPIGPQTDARKEAGEAYEHYKERFRRIFTEFGGENMGEKVAEAQEKVAGAAEKVADWLKPRPRDEE